MTVAKPRYKGPVPGECIRAVRKAPGFVCA
jgi:hypothetical protein